jgi:FMN reductase
MSQIITIAGNPASTAKSSAVLNHIQRLLRRKCIHTSSISVRDLPPADLMFALRNSPAIQEAHLSLEEARGVIIATPVYKSAYSGLLKAFLDLLPYNAFQGKVVLPIATGGSGAHLAGLDYALRPVLSALGARHTLCSVTLADEQIQFEHGGALRLDDESDARLRAGLEQLLAAVAEPAPFITRFGSQPAYYDHMGDVQYSRLQSSTYPPSAYPAEYLLEGFER